MHPINGRAEVDTICVARTITATTNNVGRNMRIVDYRRQIDNKSCVYTD